MVMHAAIFVLLSYQHAVRAELLESSRPTMLHRWRIKNVLKKFRKMCVSMQIKYLFFFPLRLTNGE